MVFNCNELSAIYLLIIKKTSQLLVAMLLLIVFFVLSPFFIGIQLSRFPSIHSSVSHHKSPLQVSYLFCQLVLAIVLSLFTCTSNSTFLHGLYPSYDITCSNKPEESQSILSVPFRSSTTSTSSESEFASLSASTSMNCTYRDLNTFEAEPNTKMKSYQSTHYKQK